MRTQLLLSTDSGPGLPSPAQTLAQLPRLMRMDLAGRDDRLLVRMGLRCGYAGVVSVEIDRQEGVEPIRIRRSAGLDSDRLVAGIDSDASLRQWLLDLPRARRIDTASASALTALRSALDLASLTIVPMGIQGDRSRLLILAEGPVADEESLLALAGATETIVQRSAEQGEQLRLSGENQTLRRELLASTEGAIDQSAGRHRLERLTAVSEQLHRNHENPLDLLRVAARSLGTDLGGQVFALMQPRENSIRVAASIDEFVMDVESLLRHALLRAGEENLERFEIRGFDAELPGLRSGGIRGHAELISAVGPCGERIVWISLDQSHFDAEDTRFFEAVSVACLENLARHQESAKLAETVRELRHRVKRVEPKTSPADTQTVSAGHANTTRTESLSAHILEQMTTGLVMVSPTGELTTVNAASRRLLDLGADTPVHVGQVQSRCGIELEHLLEAARQQQPRLVSRRVQSGTEGNRHLRVDALRVSSESGGDEGTLLAFHDITGQRAYEDRQTEFLNIVAHDLKSPLATMKTAVQLVLKEQAGPVTPDQQRFLAMTMRNVDRLNRLVGGLLDMARQRDGELILQREKCDARRLLENSLDEYLQAARQKSRELVWKIDHGTTLYVDYDRIHQVLDNLVGNALKFTSSGGSVLVTVRGDRPRPEDAMSLMAAKLGQEMLGVEIVVEDDGHGMTDAVRRRAFERFYQGDDDVGRGSGLGLAITESLVAAHQGCIDIESEAGRGTRVSVWLPGSARCALLAESIHKLEHDLDRHRSRLSQAKVVAIEATRLGEDAIDAVNRLVQGLRGPGESRWRVQRPHESCLCIVLPAEIDANQLVTDAIAAVPGLMASPGLLQSGIARFPHEGEGLNSVLALALDRARGAPSESAHSASLIHRQEVAR